MNCFVYDSDKLRETSARLKLVRGANGKDSVMICYPVMSVL